MVISCVLHEYFASKIGYIFKLMVSCYQIFDLIKLNTFLKIGPQIRNLGPFKESVL